MSKTKSIFNLVIVDASGSMKSKIEEVQGGLNQLFKELKEDEKAVASVKNKITVVDFSSHGDFNVLYNKAKPSKLKKLKDGDYVPRSMTALYDAIGKAFSQVPKSQDGVLVTIFTDGLENDSKEFKAADIKSLIEAKEALGWTITFMGTTQESMMHAQSIGIKRDRMMSYENSKKGTSYAFNKVSSARRKYQHAVLREETVDDIFDEGNVTTT